MSEPSYLDAVIDRLEANGFEVCGETPAFRRPEYASLQPNYLCVGKYLKYSPLSVIGAIQEDVFVAEDARVDENTMRLLAGRALVDAQARRQSFHRIFPVIYQYVFPVIIADQVLSDLPAHFSSNSPPHDNQAIVFPIVYDQAAGTIDYYRKIPFLSAQAHLRACHRRAEQLFPP